MKASRGRSPDAYRRLTRPSSAAYPDEAGGITSNPWTPGWSLEIVSTLTLEDRHGKTRLTIHGAPMNAAAEERKAFEAGRRGIKTGFECTFAKLDRYLAEQLAVARD